MNVPRERTKQIVEAAKGVEKARDARSFCATIRSAFLSFGYVMEPKTAIAVRTRRTATIPIPVLPTPAWATAVPRRIPGAIATTAVQISGIVAMISVHHALKYKIVSEGF